MTLVEYANLKLALLTVVAQLFIIWAFWYLIFQKNRSDKMIGFFHKYGLWMTFIVALVAMSGSLFYSDIAGFTPCTLCWYQRILMYPQVLLLAIAAFRKDKSIIKYSLALSVLGALMAGYHYLMQIGLVKSLACSAVGYSESCVKLFVMEFSYITLPLMSFTAFLLMIVLLMLTSMKKKEA